MQNEQTLQKIAKDNLKSLEAVVEDAIDDLCSILGMLKGANRLLEVKVRSEHSAELARTLGASNELK